MKVKIPDLAAKVATLLGEALALECQPQESPFPDLEDRVRILAPGTLARLILEEPPHLFGNAKSFDSKVLIDTEGTGTLLLPDDFLKLICIKMSDWTLPVTRISPVLPIHASRWKGIRGTPERPSVVLSLNSSGKRVLKIFSSAPSAVMETGLYSPAPVIASDDSLDIPDSLADKLITALVGQLKE